jgi:hypothetical protein
MAEKTTIHSFLSRRCTLLKSEFVCDSYETRARDIR